MDTNWDASRPASSNACRTAKGRLIALACLLLVGFRLAPETGVQATRVKLEGENGPTSQEVHNNYRILFYGREMWYLGFAGLLNGTDELSGHFHDDVRAQDGHWLRPQFKFNGTQFLMKTIQVKWFVPLEERTALQVYDDKKDIERARGPQVDQQLCGLHLDYMLHMVKNHASSLENASDFSIWFLMHTFETPRNEINVGSNTFAGDYNNCKRTPLGVYRDELKKVNASAAEWYFSSQNLGYPKNRRTEAARSSILQTLTDYLGPFFGFTRARWQVDMDKFQDKLDLLPMRYCMAAIRWPSWPNTTFHKRNMAMRSATCLPETCDSSSYELYADKIKQLVSYQMSAHHANYYIDHLHCLPDEESELRNPFGELSSILLIVFNVIWFMLIILATFILKAGNQNGRAKNGGSSSKRITGEPAEESKWMLYLSSWNVYRNLLDFWAAKKGTIQKGAVEVKKRESKDGSERNVVDLDPLEGFKFLSSCTVITAHSAMFIMVSNRNPDYGHHLMSRSWLAVLNMICPAVVDNFFVATGIITSKILYQSPREVLMKPLFWLNFIIYRYIRVMPLCLLVNWFLKSGFRFIGSGPFWDYGTSHTAWSKLCQEESWWTYILPSANFKAPSASCLGVGWYLANDIQFCLVTPIFIILFLNRPKLAHLTVFTVVIAAVANHIRYYYQNIIDSRSTFDWSLMYLTSVTDDLPDGYVQPYYRIPSYLIGLSAGYILVQYERGHIRRWPRLMMAHGRKFLAIVVYLLVFTPYLTSLFSFEDEHTARLWSAILSGSMHALVSAVCALFLLFLCTGHLPFIAYLYKLQVFRPLANTSLSTVLVHLPLLYYHSQTMTSLPEVTFHSAVTLTFTYCVEAFLLSIIVHVFYELPLRKFIFKFFLSLLSGNKPATPGVRVGSRDEQRAKKMD